jgi:hypothetical protein
MKTIAKQCFLGVGVIVMSVLVLRAGNKELDEQKQWEDYKRIHEPYNTSNRSNAERMERLNQLASLGDELKASWADKDYVAYASLTRELCGVIVGFNLKTHRTSYLPNHFAARVLECPDRVPPVLEAQLVMYVQDDGDANGVVAVGKERRRLRKHQAMLWLHAWRSLDAAADSNAASPDSDTDGPYANDGGLFGGEPNRLTLKARRKSEARAEAQKLRPDWVPEAERFLIRSFIEADVDVAELDGLLKEYIKDSGIRNLIMTAVKDKQMPGGRHEWRAPTQPAK